MKKSASEISEALTKVCAALEDLSSDAIDRILKAVRIILVDDSKPANKDDSNPFF